MLRACVVPLLAVCVACGAARPEEKAQGPAKLELKSLGEMLTDLGYEPKVTDNTFQLIRATHKEGTSSIWISISSNKEFVWMYTSFGLPADSDKAPAASWRKVLEANDDLGPSLFTVDEKGQRISMRRPIRNADVTPAQLRKEVNTFLDTIWKNKSLWAYPNFLPEPTAEVKKILARLDGTWRATAYTTLGKSGNVDVDKVVFKFDKGEMTVYVDDKLNLTNVICLRANGDDLWIDLCTQYGLSEVGLLKLSGDTLTLCTAPQPARPTDFASTEKEKSTLIVLKRQKR